MFYMYEFEVLRAQKKFCACARHAHLFARPRNSNFPARDIVRGWRARHRPSGKSMTTCKKLAFFSS